MKKAVSIFLIPLLLIAFSTSIFAKAPYQARAYQNGSGIIVIIPHMTWLKADPIYFYQNGVCYRAGAKCEGLIAAVSSNPTAAAIVQEGVNEYLKLRTFYIITLFFSCLVVGLLWYAPVYNQMALAIGKIEAGIELYNNGQTVAFDVTGFHEVTDFDAAEVLNDALTTGSVQSIENFL